MENQLLHYKKIWKLEDAGESFATNSGLLQPVLFEGKECMLKIGRRSKDHHANELMIWWNGDGAAKVLLYDEIAVLMERANSTSSLVEMASKGQDNEASRILTGVIARLHCHPPPYPLSLVPLTIWFKDLTVASAQYGGIFAESATIAHNPLANQQDIVALHGDIHHGNVLDFGERGWLAIDPKGLLGDRGFDYANIFCNPDAAIAARPGRLIEQATIIADAAGIDRMRLIQWIAA
jgi:streptomycin 6-kinase